MKIITDVAGKKYRLTKYSLAEHENDFRAGRTVKLSQIKKALKAKTMSQAEALAIDCYYGGTRRLNKNTAIFVVLNTKSSLTIGCREFFGEDRKILLKAIGGKS